MKKLLTLVLAIALVLAMSSIAFATEGTDTTTTNTVYIPSEAGGALTEDNNKASADVKGTYVNNNAGAVYRVDVEWGAMEFTYTAGEGSQWDPDTHTYGGDNRTGTWTSTGNTIKLTNHSNAAVNYEFKFEAAASAGAITGSFTYAKGDVTVTEQTLAAGVENKPNEADNVTATLTLAGNLNAGAEEKIGTVTVTITAVTP